MADNEDDTDGEVAESGGGGDKKGGNTLVMVIALINTLGLLGIGGYLLLADKGPAPLPMTAAPMVGDAIDKTLPGTPDRPTGGPGPLIELGVVTVNLKEPTGDRYLKAKINLELDSEETRPEVEGRLSAIKYQLTMLLSGQRVADVQGPEAMESLRKSMKRRANAMLSKGTIKEVWPEEWIVQ